MHESYVSLKSVIYLLDKLYLSSSLSTLIMEDADIPTLKELRTKNSGMQLTKEVMPVQYSETREGTLENLLMWARNRRSDDQQYPDQKGVELPNVRWGEVQEGSDLKACGWYRLELRIFDETAHVVVVLFDKNATKLVKCSADSIAQLKDEPSVSTPVKPSEEKKSIREDLEDSNAEVSPSPAEGMQDGEAGDPVDRKKKKR
ncbi:hypothetical protein Tco_0785339, partial [Tanacetum coccineum]